jgi:hypothetical protein
MKKLIGVLPSWMTFDPPTTSFQLIFESLPSLQMSSSKPTLASLQTQITELQTQHAALLARLDAFISAAAAPAEPAPKKGKRASSKPKKEKVPDAVKRAPTAFFAFSKAERAKTPDEKLTASVLAERWKLLSKEQQATFKPVPAAAASDAE